MGGLRQESEDMVFDTTGRRVLSNTQSQPELTAQQRHAQASREMLRGAWDRARTPLEVDIDGRRKGASEEDMWRLSVGGAPSLGRPWPVSLSRAPEGGGEQEVWRRLPKPETEQGRRYGRGDDMRRSPQGIGNLWPDADHQYHSPASLLYGEERTNAANVLGGPSTNPPLTRDGLSSGRGYVAPHEGPIRGGFFGRHHGLTAREREEERMQNLINQAARRDPAQAAQMLMGLQEQNQQASFQQGTLANQRRQIDAQTQSSGGGGGGLDPVVMADIDAKAAQSDLTRAETLKILRDLEQSGMSQYAEAAKDMMQAAMENELTPEGRQKAASQAMRIFTSLLSHEMGVMNVVDENGQVQTIRKADLASRPEFGERGADLVFDELLLERLESIGFNPEAFEQ